MSRQTDDGHEGWIADLFADGMYGGVWSNGPVATYTADGVLLDSKDWQQRTQDDVVGWVALCNDLTSRSSAGHCWRGSEWTRVATAAEADPGQRRLYAPDPFGLDSDSEDLIYADWFAHIAPTRGTRGVELAAADVADAQVRLTDAVREARAAGASWDAIGRAAGMTRQSAHERWSRTIAAHIQAR